MNPTPDQILTRRQDDDTQLRAKLAAQHQAGIPDQPIVERLHPTKKPMVQPGRGAHADLTRQ